MGICSRRDILHIHSAISLVREPASLYSPPIAYVQGETSPYASLRLHGSIARDERYDFLASLPP